MCFASEPAPSRGPEREEALAFGRDVLRGIDQTPHSRLLFLAIRHFLLSNTVPILGDTSMPHGSSLE